MASIKTPLSTVSVQGLSSLEAAQRLRLEGPNTLSPPQRRGLRPILRELIGDPMHQLLIAAGVIYLLLGDKGEALMLLAFVAASVAISVSQEQRTERVLEALRDLASPRALVLRDGQTLRIAGTEVVRGDLLLLAEGDRVAADATLLRSNDLQTDESLLSGESVPLNKQVAADESGQVFAGSVVVGGQGLARVTAIGAASAIGRIGKSLGEISSPASPLREQTKRMVRLFSVLGLSLSALLVLLFGLTRGDWFAGLLAGITLAMSLLPQEFLLILTVFMALGAWRMSRLRVLARRSASIETLGAATVLCTDKTGTLTLNKMAVAELGILRHHENTAMWTHWLPKDTSLSSHARQLLEYAILASESEPVDPMERALLVLGQARLPAQALHPQWQLVHEYALSSSLPAMTHVWRCDDGTYDVAIKGASEAVAALCHLSARDADAVAQQTLAMASRGLRVLGVARSHWIGPPWPASALSTPGFEFLFLGLIAFADPLRAEVPQAIAECRSAGLRVLMITGDHPVTALAIASAAGLTSALGDDSQENDVAITGAEIDAMNESQLSHCLQTHQVFARVAPQQKLRIVETLKASGQVVAMTGDGVNDAPSLKAAHIGIAMGGRGTDVAREASSLVLLDDNFDAIVSAVRLGRRIYDNLRKALAFVLAVHLPIAGLSLLPLLMGWPVILSPVHIAFLELLISPVCSVAFEAEAEESDVMQRPPRDPAAHLFSISLLLWSGLQGLVVLAVVAVLIAVLLSIQQAPDQVRALGFTALVSCNLALILANRTLRMRMMQGWLRPNPLLWRMVLATLVLLALALWLPMLSESFRFALPPVGLWLGALCAGFPVLLMLEGMKGLYLSHQTDFWKR
jgi:Ca2+-transporting ATPase